MLKEDEEKDEDNGDGGALSIFKIRLANHLSSFKDINKRFQINLSKLMQSFKDSIKDYAIKWELHCKTIQTLNQQMLPRRILLDFHIQ